MRDKRGLTLIEMVIVVVIILLLFTLAVPNFLRSIERTRWTEARTVLGMLRAAQIRYKLKYNSYATDIDSLDLDISTPKYFTFSVANDEQNLAKAWRNSVAPVGFTGLYMKVKKSGEFDYEGLPAWLQ